MLKNEPTFKRENISFGTTTIVQFLLWVDLLPVVFKLILLCQYTTNSIQKKSKIGIYRTACQFVE